MSQEFRDLKMLAEWKKLRHMAFKAHGRKCQKCQLTGQGRLVVHHRHYRSVGHEAPEDVAVLCKACHEALHARQRAHRLVLADAPFVDPGWCNFVDAEKKP